MNLVLLLVIIEPSGRLVKVPKIGLAEIFLTTVKTVPMANVPLPLYAEMKTAVVKEWAKIAMSDDPFGTVIGDQLLAVFQSPAVAPLEGAHVTLTARAALSAANEMSESAVTIRR